MNLLIIDDDRLVRRAVGRLLMSAHSVSFADGGAEALSLIQAGNSYDAILCDFRMNGMNGDVFYEKLETLDPTLVARVIFITGGTQAAKDDAFLRTKRMLRKPFDVAALDAELREVGAAVTIR